MFQCARGHIVCSECRPNVTTCPQCRDPLGNIRSLISEKMLEKLPCVCKFTDQGCQVSPLDGWQSIPCHGTVQKLNIVLKVKLFHCLKKWSGTANRQYEN